MAGTSLPTGSNDASRNGLRVDEHGQRGAGGFGPYLGLFFAGAWLFARAQLPVRTALLGEQTVGPVFTAGIRYEAL